MTLESLGTLSFQINQIQIGFDHSLEKLRPRKVLNFLLSNMGLLELVKEHIDIIKIKISHPFHFNYVLVSKFVEFLD